MSPRLVTAIVPLTVFNVLHCWFDRSSHQERVGGNGKPRQNQTVFRQCMVYEGEPFL